MSDHLHQALERIEHELKSLERAASRGEMRDKHFEAHFRRQQELQHAIVRLLQEILRELQRHPPQFFLATSGLTIRPVK